MPILTYAYSAPDSLAFGFELWVRLLQEAKNSSIAPEKRIKKHFRVKVFIKPPASP